MTPLAIIGAMFLVLLMTGLLVNGKQCAIALDQFVGTCLRPGHKSDETISAWAHRCHHRRAEQFINWLFRDPTTAPRRISPRWKARRTPRSTGSDYLRRTESQHRRNRACL